MFVEVKHAQTSLTHRQEPGRFAPERSQANFLLVLPAPHGFRTMNPNPFGASETKPRPLSGETPPPGLVGPGEFHGPARLQRRPARGNLPGLIQRVLTEPRPRAAGGGVWALPGGRAVPGGAGSRTVARHWEEVGG